jgi:hypothetical protein
MSGAVFNPALLCYTTGSRVVLSHPKRILLRTKG